ncbi:hypothetical protein [Pseudarthrobacter sp. NamE5]|uniref:hypothetical protein n=1 Tax=Pseudarthrobacter sp. NamE5 TaxID=2576839 RepID=UPI00110BF6AB|nr:hypothetical protein [Pseudarthrobacter sp. NamE5]TLM87993.1 hypothetical protein FDW84_00190 [Pseudarthrobacter sp. NamE5]
MDQGQAGVIGFREVDQDGNPISDYGADSGDTSSRGIGMAVNPFIAALWLLAALLIGGGGWIFINADLMVGPAANGMPAPFLLFTLAPYLMFAGFAALISLLLWHALQWQRRHG